MVLVVRIVIHPCHHFVIVTQPNEEELLEEERLCPFCFPGPPSETRTVRRRRRRRRRSASASD